MSENTNMVPNSADDVETFLPEGWAEGDDIFDMSSWTGGSQADESGADGQDETDEGAAEGTEAAHAIEQALGITESSDEGEESPAIETGAKAANKFRFNAQIDHKMEEIELDEDDLPTIYQKSRATDRYKDKLAKAQPTLDKGNRLAKMLGFESIDEMLESAEANYRQGEIDKLTEDNVHPEVAEELVNSRMQRIVADPVEADDDGSSGPRDFKGEVEDLLKVHSELRGQKLPDEVVNEAVVKGRPLVRAYEDYLSKQKEAETKALKKENKTLKHNAEAARRAPVRGVSRGGAADLEPDDPFLKGFNSGY